MAMGPFLGTSPPLMGRVWDKDKPIEIEFENFLKTRDGLGMIL